MEFLDTRSFPAGTKARRFRVVRDNGRNPSDFLWEYFRVRESGEYPVWLRDGQHRYGYIQVVPRPGVQS